MSACSRCADPARDLRDTVLRLRNTIYREGELGFYAVVDRGSPIAMRNQFPSVSFLV